MENSRKTPFEIEWGEMFVESYNVNTKTATLIFNFNFGAIECLDDFLKYSVGRLFWVHKNIPKKSNVTAIYDLRGLTVDLSILKDFEERLKEKMWDIDRSIQLNIVFHK